MCGIVGCVGEKNAGRLVLNKLKNLQYRGYDSAGIGANSDGKIDIIKSVGNVEKLEEICNPEILKSDCVIGHTRWATHGKVCVENAHPCLSGGVAVVHNGIFENYAQLGDLILNTSAVKEELDSLVFAKCLDKMLRAETNLTLKKVSECLRFLLNECVGTWALCILVAQFKDTIFFAKNKSPLVIGKSLDGMWLCSDSNSISDSCNFVCDLNDGDFGWVSSKKLQVYNKFGRVSVKKFNKVVNNDINMNLGKCSCFMENEIEEGLVSAVKAIEEFSLNSEAVVKKLSLRKPFCLCACGSAFNAGLCLKYWMEKFLNKSLDCVYGSEFCYRPSLVKKKGAVLLISQSGETADTLNGADLAKNYGCVLIGFVNNVASSLTKKCDFVIKTFAGKETAVAATKTYVAQLASGLAFVSALYNKFSKTPINIAQLCAKLRNVNYDGVKTSVEQVADIIKEEESIYFIGRGVDYYIAKEGALKLREVSYIHVEALPAGELKHGSLALINSTTFVVVILTQANQIKKTMNNVAEVKSRGGKIIMFSQFDEVGEKVDYFVKVPKMEDEFMPIIMAKPLQLLACYTALKKGLNPDMPRNLAKSVTVE